MVAKSLAQDDLAKFLWPHCTESRQNSAWARLPATPSLQRYRATGRLKTSLVAPYRERQMLVVLCHSNWCPVLIKECSTWWKDMALASSHSSPLTFYSSFRVVLFPVCLLLNKSSLGATRVFSCFKYITMVRMTYSTSVSRSSSLNVLIRTIRSHLLSHWSRTFENEWSNTSEKNKKRSLRQSKN